MIKRCFSTLGCTERTLSEILDLANRYNISAVEVRGLGGELRNELIYDFIPENTLQTRKAFENSGVRPLVLGTSVSFHDENKYEKNIEDGILALEIADRIGFSAIRVFGDRIIGDEKECICRVAEGIRKLCLCAADTGVSVLLEVHGDFNTSVRLLPICECCGDMENFGLIWDICHTYSHYRDNWRDFYNSLSAFIRHVHIKDIKAGDLVLPGMGELPIVQVVEYLVSKDYGGYFSLEWEKHWHKELPEIEEALDKFLNLL